VEDRAAVSGLAGRRIVFVVAGEVLGGAERNAISLAVRFARVERADVTIFALDDRPGRARAFAEAEGISWTSVGTPWVGGRAARLLSLLRVARSLRRLRPDVLLPWTNLANVVCGLTWRATGARLCIWNQCDVLGTKRISRRLFRRALHASPLVVTTAFHARDWLADEWGFDRRRVHVIRSEVTLPPPVDTAEDWRARLGIAPGNLVACMIGHLHEGKDHDTLLRAWRLVVDALQPEQDAVLLLAGRPAGAEDAVKGLAFDLDLRRHIRFLDDVADISGLLEAVDLAVFSSRSECLGRGATEPMYAGRAVVGTDVPGIREAVGERGHAFLAVPGDEPALADAILRLARDPELRAALGKANAELIRARQGSEATSGAYAQLVADALAGRRRDAREQLAAGASAVLSVR
jgi:glycosyltransferase involved in cell wall biosynthesis